MESTSKGGLVSKERLKYEIKDKSFSGKKFRSRRDRQIKRGLHEGNGEHLPGFTRRLLREDHVGGELEEWDRVCVWGWVGGWLFGIVCCMFFFYNSTYLSWM